MQVQSINYCSYLYVNSLPAFNGLILYIYNSGYNCCRANDNNGSFWLSFRLLFNEVVCYRQSRQSYDPGFFLRKSLWRSLEQYFY